MINFPITSAFAAAFAGVMLILWINVTKTRAVQKISIGDGGNVELHERIRRHGNFIEWVPMTLILLALAEAQGSGAPWLLLAGGLALAGRLLHPFGLRADNPAHVVRIIANSANIAETAVLIALLLVAALA